MSRMQAEVDRLRGTAMWLISKLPLKTQAMLWEATVEEVDRALLDGMGQELKAAVRGHRGRPWKEERA